MSNLKQKFDISGYKEAQKALNKFISDNTKRWFLSR